MGYHHDELETPTLGSFLQRKFKDRREDFVVWTGIKERPDWIHGSLDPIDLGGGKVGIIYHVFFFLGVFDVIKAKLGLNHFEPL